MNTAKRKLEGKIAVITGGNSGIGRATAQLFNQEGARIALIGRDQKSVDETLAELSGENLGFKGDVTSEKDLNGFFDQVRSRFGKIDILFINAGIAEQSMIADTSPEFYDRHFNINVRGAFFAVQKALPLLQKGSSIVVTTSVVSHFGGAGSSVYSATKAALRSMVQCWAAELLPEGIRVNSVSPGPTATSIINRNVADEKAFEPILEFMKNMVPMKRMGEPLEVAKAVLFMASEDSSFTTGAELMVDGGMTQVR